MQTELRFDRWYLPLSVPVGLGPKRSELRVEAGAIHVKMGWAFDADIPLTSITKAETATPRVFTRGVHYSGAAGWSTGRARAVALTIEPPAEAKAVTGSVTVRALWVSVTDPDALIAACTAARALAGLDGLPRRVNQSRWRRTNSASTTLPWPGT